MVFKIPTACLYTSNRISPAGFSGSSPTPCGILPLTSEGDSSKALVATGATSSGESTSNSFSSKKNDPPGGSVGSPLNGHPNSRQGRGGQDRTSANTSGGNGSPGGGVRGTGIGPEAQLEAATGRSKVNAYQKLSYSCHLFFDRGLTGGRPRYRYSSATRACLCPPTIPLVAPTFTFVYFGSAEWGRSRHFPQLFPVSPCPHLNAARKKAGRLAASIAEPYAQSLTRTQPHVASRLTLPPKGGSFGRVLC